MANKYGMNPGITRRIRRVVDAVIFKIPNNYPTEPKQVAEAWGEIQGKAQRLLLRIEVLNSEINRLSRMVDIA
jgi:hypothetical protein